MEIFVFAISASCYIINQSTPTLVDVVAMTVAVRVEGAGGRV